PVDQRSIGVISRHAAEYHARIGKHSHKACPQRNGRPIQLTQSIETTEGQIAVAQRWQGIDWRRVRFWQERHAGRQAHELLRELTGELTRGEKVLIGKVVVHRLQARCAWIPYPGCLDWRWFAGKSQ